MVRIQAGIHRENLPQAANQQTGAREENKSDGDFGDDEDFANQLLAPRSGGTSLLKCAIQIESRSRECRKNSANEPGKHRDSNGVKQHARVENTATQAGYVGIEFRHESDSPNSEEESCNGSCSRKQETFGEKLPHDVRTRRAERKTDRNFLLAAGGTGHHEVGSVEAGDQQNAKD
jgi:hypothetical protein